MNRFSRLIMVCLAFMGSIAMVKGQETTYQATASPETRSWEAELKLGVNIGGAAPLPMPREVRKIELFNPKFNGSVEGTFTKWFGNSRQWGASVGVKLEKKGMKTGATVKNYHTEVIQGTDRIAGFYTGYVKTNYSATLLTVPVLANYRISNRWKVRAGVFGSIKLDGQFNGHVRDGYLRENTPTGTKIMFEGDSKGPYDFTSNLKKFQWGAQMGGSWRVDKHVSLIADLTWAFSDIFKKDFKTITFDLHPIYLNLGVSYRL